MDLLSRHYSECVLNARPVQTGFPFTQLKFYFPFRGKEPETHRNFSVRLSLFLNCASCVVVHRQTGRLAVSLFLSFLFAFSFSEIRREMAYL